MFLGLRELRFARMRFALMGAVVALIAVLMVLLSGLSAGLVNDGVSGLKKLPVTSFAFEQGVQTDAAFSRSVVDLAAVDAWRKQPGVVEAAPFGNTLVNARNERGTDIDLALFGVEPGSFLAHVLDEARLQRGMPPIRFAVENLYLASLSRAPTNQELRWASGLFDANPDTLGVLQDLFWALLNSNEFVLNK